MSAPTGPQLTKRQQQGLESREQILDAAERLMAARGVTGASVSALMRASGLPASSIYWHFGSKDGVLAAVMERGARRFFDSLTPGASFRVTGAERVRAQLSDAARALEAHGDFLRLVLTLMLLRHEGNDRSDEVLARVRRTARERIEAMIGEAFGESDPRGASRAARELVDFVLAAIDGAFLAHHGEGRVDLHVLFEQLSRAIEVLAHGSFGD